jgi:UDP-glucose 4-epimerase
MLNHLDLQPKDPRRVVLLGAAGFLSLHIQTLLGAAGIPFLALGSQQLDLTGGDAAAGLAGALAPDDTLLMLSAITPDKGGGFQTFVRNVRMAESVCAALQKAPCRHLVYVSSDAVYDAHKTPLDEDSSREPLDLYAAMHTAREMMLESATRERKIPFCVLRPTNVYGAGDTHDSYGPNRFIRTALAERRILLFGQGEERRNHLYIRDASQLILRTLRHRSTGTLNLAANRSWSFHQVADAIRRLLPFDVALEYRPRQLAIVHKPYKPTQVFRFLYNLGRRISPVVHRPYLIGGLRKAFPDFVFTDLDTGLAESIAAASQPKAGVPV